MKSLKSDYNLRFYKLPKQYPLSGYYTQHWFDATLYYILAFQLLNMPSNRSPTPLPSKGYMPDRGLSVETVRAFAENVMAADIPPSHDLGR